MADTELTLTNNSGVEQIYGGVRVADGATFTIQDGDREPLLEDSVSFLPDLNSGDATIDNGVFDLTAAVALRALRNEQQEDNPAWHAAGTPTVGSFLKEMQLPPGIGEFKAPFSGYIAEAVVSQFGTAEFEIEILVNDIVEATILFPAAGSTQESVVTQLAVPILREDSIAIRVSDGTPEDPIARLTLKDW